MLVDRIKLADRQPGEGRKSVCSFEGQRTRSLEDLDGRALIEYMGTANRPRQESLWELRDGVQRLCLDAAEVVLGDSLQAQGGGALPSTARGSSCCGSACSPRRRMATCPGRSRSGGRSRQGTGPSSPSASSAGTSLGVPPPCEPEGGEEQAARQGAQPGLPQQARGLGPRPFKPCGGQRTLSSPSTGRRLTPTCPARRGGGSRSPRSGGAGS